MGLQLARFGRETQRVAGHKRDANGNSEQEDGAYKTSVA